MNAAKSHLNLLVQLAKVDGVVVQEEIDLIHKVGKANGLSSEEISDSFDDPSEIEGLDELSDDMKFEYMYNIVQLMKIDGRIYKEEIIYCAHIASRLGYDENVVREMMLKVYSDPHLTSDKSILKSSIQKFLNH